MGANTIRASVTQAQKVGRLHRVRISTRQGAFLKVVATDAQPNSHYMDQVCPHCEELYFKAKYDFQMMKVDAWLHPIFQVMQR